MDENLFDTDLLNQIEVGSNVFELIEFSLERRLPDGTMMKGIYGVNVSKVREVVRMPKINPLAANSEGLAGIFEIRGIPIPAINLGQVLGDRRAAITQNQQIIVTEFSQKRAGFIVETTHRIRRVEWSDVLPPSSDAGSCMSGMILIEDNEFLFILDLEKILAEIEASASSTARGGTGQPVDSVYSLAPQAAAPVAAKEHKFDPSVGTLLLVDDSSLIRNNVCTALERIGFNVVTAENGALAYELMEEIVAGSGPVPKIDYIISDVEMPRMDGLTFVKKVRETDGMNEIPIVMHTSLSGQANQDAGFAVGANGYIVKNNIKQLVEHIKEVLGDDLVPSAA